MAVSPDATPYLAGAHLFGSASPVNFWDTFRLRELEHDLDAFKTDGFNAVVLLIPWAQFQPSVHPVAFAPQYFARLDAVFEAAKRRGMQVILRVGYLWESSPSLDSTYQRYREFFLRGELPWAWRLFNGRVHDQVKNKENFAFAFLSWEDFYWPMLIWAGTAPLETRVDLARQLGFRDYVRRRFTIGGLQQIYGWDVQRLNDLPIPTASEPAHELFLRFYEEELLARITAQSLEAFPDIRFEARVDPDWIKRKDGLKFHHWSMNQWGPRPKVVYYHSSIGLRPTHSLNVDAALAHLDNVLHTYTRNLDVGEAKVFIDQFNFFDDTYTEWSKIEGSGLPDFISRSRSILENYTSGYAIWGYRDWRKDVLFNGSFDLKDEGWLLTGDARVAPFDGAGKLPGHIVSLRALGALEQRDIPLSLSADMTKKVSVQGTAGEVSTLQVTAHGQELAAQIEPGNFTHVFEFDQRQVSSVKLACMEGSVKIYKMQLFDRVYSQGLKSVDGAATPASDALRALNFRLSGLEPHPKAEASASKSASAEQSAR